MLRVWVIVACMGVPVAAADPTSNRPPALRLLAEADKAYNAGDFERAVKLLREAYDLYPEPILLSHLARALEGVGDTEQAIINYERYLAAATKIEDRAAIERRLVTLREQLDAREKAAHPEPKPEPTPEPKPAPVPPPVREPPREEMLPPPPSSLPAYLTIAAGLAAAGTGTYFALQASHEHSVAVDDPVQLEAQTHQDRAHRDATIANITLIGGGALVVGGAIWAIATHRRGHAKVSVTATPSSVGLAWELP